MQHPCPSSRESSSKVKCVLVGDGTVGKTSLIVSYTTSGFPAEYVPTAYDKYNVLVTVNREPVQLQLCDTAGQDDFDRLRPLSYPGVDVFLLCFSIVNPMSFLNVKEKWFPELQSNEPGVPIVLVGTQLDLRNDVRVLVELAGYGERPVSEDEGRSAAADIGAMAYIECSALTQKNLKEVFDSALTAAFSRLESQQRQKQQRSPVIAFNSKEKIFTKVRRKGTSKGQPSRPSHKPWWKHPFSCFA